MSAEAVRAAVASYPELRRLVDLGTAGWRFVHHTQEGRVVQIDAFWSWPSGWLDCVRIRSASEALGLRTDGADPPGISWERIGGLAEVIDAITNLPPPTHPRAPRLIRGRAPRLWTPEREG